MKLFSAKKFERKFYRIYYSFVTNEYVNEITTVKKSYITFLGFPLFPNRVIVVSDN